MYSVWRCEQQQDVDGREHLPQLPGCLHARYKVCPPSNVRLSLNTHAYGAAVRV